MKTKIKLYTIVALAGLLSIGMYSCGYDEITSADFPASKIYMPSAVNGIYTIAAAPPLVGASRFKLNDAQTKFIVPLSIYRSGVFNNGSVTVSLASRADTVTSLLDAGSLAGMESLPEQYFSFPGSVVVEDGKNIAEFQLEIDLDFLLGNSDKKFAFAVGVTGSGVPVSFGLGTTIIAVDAALFKPTANFSFAKSGADPLLYTFTNSSLNGVTYSWSFGDGSQSSTEVAPVHRFPGSGTFSVELTAFGVAGAFSSVKTVEIVVE